MADPTSRVRRIRPADPGGEPVCRLTADGARGRHVAIDRLLEVGVFEATADGYEIRLPSGEQYWSLANDFAEEESDCCPALGLEVEERARGIIVRAAFS